MPGNRIFSSVVLVGLALAGCDKKTTGADVQSPDNAEKEPPDGPQPSPTPEANARGGQSPDNSAAPATADPPDPPGPPEQGDPVAAEDECPAGSDMPDPPCFYIL